MRWLFRFPYDRPTWEVMMHGATWGLIGVGLPICIVMAIVL